MDSKSIFLIALVVAAALAYNPVTPFNYCAEKDSHCMTCMANGKGFLDETCGMCFRGYPMNVPQIPGSQRCRPYPDTNPLCLVAYQNPET